MTVPPSATVIVCTRNRARSLAATCDSLLALDYPAERCNLLIVDNGSTDETSRVADDIRNACGGRVELLSEPQLGLSAARNAGVRHATGEIVVFLDDDALPERSWLRSLTSGLVEHGAMVAGGPVDPLLEGDPPPWLTQRFMPYLSAWDRGSEPAWLFYNEYPRGANIAFRREVFARFGQFSPHLGRRGRSLRSCEEIELCLRVERAGGRILYVPDARVRHRTRVDRLTVRWLESRYFAQGHSEGILEWQHGGWRGTKRSWLRHLQWTREAHRRRHVEPDGSVHARCQRRALVGYFLGALAGPLTVPRYRFADGSVGSWLP